MNRLVLEPGTIQYLYPGESVELQALLNTRSAFNPTIECPYGCSVKLSTCVECDCPVEECVNSPYTGRLGQCPTEIPKQWWELEMECSRGLY